MAGAISLVSISNANASPAPAPEGIIGQDAELFDLHRQLRAAFANYKEAEQRAKVFADQADAARVQLPDVCRRLPDDKALFGTHRPAPHPSALGADKFGVLVSSDEHGEYHGEYYGRWEADELRRWLKHYDRAIEPLPAFQVRRKARIAELVNAFDAWALASEPSVKLRRAGEELLGDGLAAISALERKIMSTPACTAAGVVVKACAAMAFWSVDADDSAKWINPPAEGEIGHPDDDDGMDAEDVLWNLARDILVIERQQTGD
jgi:hypothetical protein